MRKYLFLLLICFASIVSCKEDSDVVEQPVQNEVNPIAEAAIKFKNDIIGNSTRAGQTECAVKFIKKMQSGVGTTRTAEDDRSLYSVAFDQNMGSVVLAEINESYVPLAYFMKEQDLDIDECLKDTISDLGFLMGYLTEVGLTRDIESHSTRASNEEEIIERVEPKCQAFWIQDMDPYNRYCFTSKGKQAVTGCVALAGAQALTVLQPREPIAEPWEWLIWPQPSEAAKDRIGKLIYFVAKSIHTDFGTEQSSAYYDELRKFLQCQYFLVDYDAVRAIEVLNTKHGVIIIHGYRAIHGWGPWEHYVDGHTFIGDGYVKYKKDKDTYYLHLNYGDGKAHRDVYHRDVYVLSSKKKWKAKEAREAGYSYLYTHDLRYSSWTYPSERYW